MRVLAAIPVYNEETYVRRVLERVLRVAPNVLVIDDGSSDRTPHILPEFPIDIVRHHKNRGYGRSIRDAFRWAMCEGYDWLITMDCDEQHEPERIPAFVEAARDGDADIISGSRYMPQSLGEDHPPPERRAINAEITQEVNRRLADCLGAPLTDAFCGFKAYRVEALRSLRLTENGYAFPMQFWAQAAAARLRVRELPVKLIYNDPTRTFGGTLDDARVRLAHYRDVLHRELRRVHARLPAGALAGVAPAPCCNGRACRADRPEPERRPAAERTNDPWPCLG